MARHNRVAQIGMYLFLIATSISIGIGIGAKVFRSDANRQTIDEVHLTGYRFISPLIDYHDSNELLTIEIKRLKRNIKYLIDEQTSDGNVLYVSVYFRDLLNGPWFSINQKIRFIPASLLKVPVLIAYLKYAEMHPYILQQTLPCYKNKDLQMKQFFKPSHTLEEGTYYTVDELIHRMIAFSDNDANDTLLLYMDEGVRNQIYSELGIDLHIKESDAWLNVEEYAIFFRILFNASYLNKEMSEKALEILSQCDFKAGLVAGVPKGVTVAHKFAERGNPINDMQQLHDCGIVYYKDRPYLINIMTEGRDINKLVKIIKDISSEVYTAIDQHYKSQ